MDSATTKTLVSIVTYNRPELCARLLESLDGIASNPFDVYLSENKSDAKYLKLILRDYRFHIIHKQLDDNYGLCRPTNQAIRYAMEHGYDYIWVLDDDTLVEETTLRYLVELMEQDAEIAVAGSAIYDIDQRHKLMQTGAFFSFKSLSQIMHRETDQVSLVDYVTDCSSLARINHIKKHAIFYDESYFIHAEDVDFPMLFKEFGYKIAVQPRSKIFHKCLFEKYSDKSFMVYYDVRNMLYLHMKLRPREFQKTCCLRIFSERNIYHFLCAAALSFMAGDLALAHAFYFAVKDLYGSRMGKSDLYQRMGMEMSSGRIAAREIVVPHDVSPYERGPLLNLLSQQAEKSAVMIRDRKFSISDYVRGLLFLKRFECLVIPSHNKNIRYPLLARKLIKFEDGRLAIYSFDVFSTIRFMCVLSCLFVKVMLRKAFRFKQWRHTVLWEGCREPIRALDSKNGIR